MKEGFEVMSSFILIFNDVWLEKWGKAIRRQIEKRKKIMICLYLQCI